MNEAFSPPLVDAIRGGARGGGATLIEQGHKVLASFRRLEDCQAPRGMRNCLSSAGRPATL
jgi:molybdate transport system regulatory protein